MNNMTWHEAVKYMQNRLPKGENPKVMDERGYVYTLRLINSDIWVYRRNPLGINYRRLDILRKIIPGGLSTQTYRPYTTGGRALCKRMGEVRV